MTARLPGGVTSSMQAQLLRAWPQALPTRSSCRSLPPLRASRTPGCLCVHSTPPPFRSTSFHVGGHSLPSAASFSLRLEETSWGLSSLLTVAAVEHDLHSVPVCNPAGGDHSHDIPCGAALRSGSRERKPTHWERNNHFVGLRAFTAT